MRLRLALLLALCALCLPASAGAVRFELGRADGGAKVVRDRGASKGRALQLIGRERVRKVVSTQAITRLAVRAKGRRCRGWPTLAVRLNGRRVAAFRVRSGRWRNYARRLRRPAGGHVLDLRLGNPKLARRCVRALRLDVVSVTTRPPPRRRPPPPPPPPPAPAQVQIPPGHFANPVYASGFADPTVLDVGGRHDEYYAFGTGEKFPMLRSTDLVHWTSAGTALTARPSWTAQTGEWNPWAPNAIETDEACPGERTGPCYVMFFVSVNRNVEPDSNCIGVAVSAEPSGPFADRGILTDEAGSLDASGRPIGCGDDNGYSNIDPAPFVDEDGSAYLYLSTGHLCAGQPPGATCPFDRRLSVIPLSDDLLTATGPRQPLLGWGEAWEQQIVENPWPRRRGDTYELFFSGGNYRRTYGMGYATAASPTGPFSKAPVNPILKDSAEVLSAGGGSLVTGPRGGEWVAYHGRSGDYALPRLLRMDRLLSSPEGTLTVAGPTTTPQPVP
jgi:hypothetical protein